MKAPDRTGGAHHVDHEIEFWSAARSEYRRAWVARKNFVGKLGSAPILGQDGSPATGILSAWFAVIAGLGSSKSAGFGHQSFGRRTG